MKPKGGKREGAGRKPIQFDWESIDTLLMIACTGEEIASVLGVDYKTIERRCQSEKGIDFGEYIKNGINKNFKPSLRRTQRTVALGKLNDDGSWLEKPNVTMLIWLGKQYLGQSDKSDITTGGDKITEIDYSKLSEATLKEIVNAKNSKG